MVYSLHGLGFHVFDALNGEETAVVEVGEKVKELRITPFNQIVLLPASRKGLYLFDLYTRSFIKKIPGYETYFGLQRLQLTQEGTKAISYNDFEIPAPNLQTSEIQGTPKRPFLGNRQLCKHFYRRCKLCQNSLIRQNPTHLQILPGANADCNKTRLFRGRENRWCLPRCGWSPHRYDDSGSRRADFVSLGCNFFKCSSALAVLSYWRE